MTRKRISMFGWAGLAVVVGIVAGVWTTSALEAAGAPAPRLAELERRTRALESGVRARAQLSAALTTPLEPEWLPPYRIACPEPWRELGAIGQGLWGCQAPEPLPNGFYPNCNLTSSAIQPGLSAQRYYETVTASAQLAATRQYGGQAVHLRHQGAFQGSFEHHVTGMPLRVFATIVVQADRVFAITCSAPPPNFDGFLPRFREIAGSFDLGEGVD